MTGGSVRHVRIIGELEIAALGLAIPLSEVYEGVTFEP
jgi:hypothetical protein